MEITLTRGRLWIGSSPQKWLVTSDTSLKRIIRAKSHGKPDETTLCLYLRFLGGLSHSGILGLTFKGSSDENLVLKVPIAKESSDVNYVGLTDRLANCVLQEAELALTSIGNVISGDLNFNYAHANPVDSSPFIFMLLTRVLISILNTELHQIDRNIVDEMVVRNRKLIESRRTS